MDKENKEFNDEKFNEELELDVLEEDEYYEEEEDFQEFTLTLEDGSELECVIIAQFEVNEQGYIALLPIEGEDKNILLYRINEKDDETFEVSMIESDEEFEAASEAYYEVVDEDLEFIGHDECGCGCGHNHDEDSCGCGHSHDSDSCGCDADCDCN